MSRWGHRRPRRCWIGRQVYLEFVEGGGKDRGREVPAEEAHFGVGRAGGDLVQEEESGARGGRHLGDEGICDLYRTVPYRIVSYRIAILYRIVVSSSLYRTVVMAMALPQ